MDPILLLILMVVLLALPIWTTFRQNKQLRQIRDMQARLAVGAEVLTGSGQHGIVVAVDEKTVDLEIAEGIVTRWERAAIVRNVSEEEAAAAQSAAAQSASAQSNSQTAPQTAPEPKAAGDDAATS